MASTSEAIAILERLSASLSPTYVVELRREDIRSEPFLNVTILSNDGAASASFWAREDLGGFLDLEVVDGDGNQRLWRHLEVPTATDINEAWNEMLTVYRSLVSNHP
jgi:hypothetical protein